MIRLSNSHAVLLGALLMSACEEPFQPLQETDRLFSMYGVLELGADTQWIRVMPIRTSIFTHPEPIDARVTLEHLGTGRTVELRDSLIRYPAADRDAIEDRWAHNFWTTEPLEPEGSYRIKAVRPDGATSSAVVAMPPMPDRVAVEIAQPGPGQTFLRDYVRVERVTHLAMVNVHYILTGCGLDLPYVEFHQPHSAVSAEEGAPRVAVTWRTQRTVCGGPPSEDDWRDLKIVVSGSAWPFDANLAAGVYQHVDAASNVEGGIGYLGGIVTLQVPYEICRAAPGNPNPPVFCEIVYDRNSVLLEGTALDMRCEGRPLPRVTVTVVEPGGEWIRPVVTDALGRYRIGGLQPGRIFQLHATAPGFHPLEATLEFSAGERRVHDLEMARTSSCPTL